MVTALLIALLLTAAAVAQKKVPPPGKPADSGPSLVVTTKFIQDKLNDQGTFNHLLYVHDDVAGSDWVLRRTLSASNVIVDPGACSITYHWKTTQNGSQVSDSNLSFSLQAVQTISVLTTEQEVKLVDTDAGVLGHNYRSDPSFFMLRVARSHTLINTFPVHDEDTANRLAKALTHAVELCGGGQNEPF
jgi:hypothetical protein